MTHRLTVMLAVASTACTSSVLDVTAPIDGSVDASEPLLPALPLVTPPIDSLMTAPVDAARAACGESVCLVVSGAVAFRYGRPSGSALDASPWPVRVSETAAVRAVAERQERFAVAYDDGCFAFISGRDARVECIPGFDPRDLVATSGGFLTIGRSPRDTLAAWEWTDEGLVLRAEADVAVDSAFALVMGEEVLVLWRSGAQFWMAELDTRVALAISAQPATYYASLQFVDAAALGSSILLALDSAERPRVSGLYALDRASLSILGATVTCGSAELSPLGDGLLVHGSCGLVRVDNGGNVVPDTLDLYGAIVLPLSTTRLLILDDDAGRVRERFVTYR